MMKLFSWKSPSTAMVWKNRPESYRDRADSTGESEKPDKYAKGFLGDLQKKLYPPDSDYYWYRNGTVNHTDLGTKYINFVILNFVMAIAGSGTIVGIFIYIVHLVMQFLYTGPLHFGVNDSITPEQLKTLSELPINSTALAMGEMHPEWIKLSSNPLFVFAWMISSGISTLIIYMIGAEWYRNEFYVKRAGAEEEVWKCQPYRHLNDEIAAEEKRWGCINSFLAGFAGVFLFFLDQNYPFLKLYYDLSRGYLHFFGGALFVFLWIDLWSYFAHRLLHSKFLYLNVHKWHHRYIVPTAYSAFAMSPIEFLIFQSAGICCLCFFEIHVVAFLAVVTHIAYHNQVDHSGIHFESEFFWGASSKYHSDHHYHWHVNFGLGLILWDWLFGTLRKKSKEYSEDNFGPAKDKNVNKSKDD